MHLNNIRKELSELKKDSRIIDEVRTIELLLESIQKKVTSVDGSRHKECFESTAKKSVQSRQEAVPSTSPIKQLDDLNSRIVYTNFSLKEASSQKQSIYQSEL